MEENKLKSSIARSQCKTDKRSTQHNNGVSPPQEVCRLRSGMDFQVPLLGNAAIAAAIKSGNVNIASNMRVEEMDLSSESRESQLQHAETLRRFEAQQRARSMIVPTLVEDVKRKLRELGQPVTMFGEGPADRRERLKDVIARMELNESEAREMQVSSEG
jgi:U4/U6 small nuclear ribonucleoprotein PRP4